MWAAYNRVQSSLWVLYFAPVDFIKLTRIQGDLISTHHKDAKHAAMEQVT